VVEVVGVYDTVGALGFPELLGYKLGWGPDKYGFHNVKLSSSKFRPAAGLYPVSSC